MTGTEVTLPQMLECRERRAAIQNDFLRRYRAPLISFCMNIPGPIKTNAQIRAAFDAGMQALKAALAQEDTVVLEAVEIHEPTGDEWIAAVSLSAADGGESTAHNTGDPATRLKNLTLRIEETHPLGRLFDMDVLAADGTKLSRPRYRKCLLCGRQAQECARARTHSVAEMQEAMDALLQL